MRHLRHILAYSAPLHSGTHLLPDQTCLSALGSWPASQMVSAPTSKLSSSNRKLPTWGEGPGLAGEVVNADFGIPLFGGAIAIIVGASRGPTHGDVFS